MTRGWIIAAMVWAGSVGATEITAPSGAQLTLFDVVLEGDTARFRFHAPQIGGDDPAFGYTQVVDDFQWLCETYALPALANASVMPTEIVISMASAQVPFGESAPDIVQFFEAYAPMGDVCEWKDF